MRNHPFWTLGIIYIYGTFFFSLAFRISEKPKGRNDLTSIFTSYELGLWVTTVTNPTVGYGDYYPTTHLGRVTMVGICQY